MFKSNLSDGSKSVSTNLFIISELVLPFSDLLHKFLDFQFWEFISF